jgi:hypothetical protein
MVVLRDKLDNNNLSPSASFLSSTHDNVLCELFLLHYEAFGAENVSQLVGIFHPFEHVFVFLIQLYL